MRKALHFLLILGFGLALATPARAFIDAAEGSQYLYLTTGPEDAHGGGTLGVDLNEDGSNEGDASSVAVSFEAAAAGMLSFRWDVLTGEVSGGVSDWFSILLDGVEILAESIFTPDDAPLPPPGLMGFADGAILGPDGSLFEDGRLGWMLFETPIDAATHTLRFTIYDDEDLEVDSALLLDALALDEIVFQGFEAGTVGLPPMLELEGRVTVEGSDSFSQIALPEPGAALLGLMAGIGLAGIRRRR